MRCFINLDSTAVSRVGAQRQQLCNEGCQSVLQGMQKIKHSPSLVPQQVGAVRCCQHAAVGDAVLSMTAPGQCHGQPHLSVRHCSVRHHALSRVPVVAGWGNQELQTYQAANAAVRSGVVSITAQRVGTAFTSARITSAGKRDFAPAEGETLRVEARLQLPQGECSLECL